MPPGLFELFFRGSELIDIFVFFVGVQFGSVRLFLKDGFLSIVVIERDMDSFEVLMFEQLRGSGSFSGGILQH